VCNGGVYPVYMPPCVWLTVYPGLYASLCVREGDNEARSILPVCERERDNEARSILLLCR